MKTISIRSLKEEAGIQLENGHTRCRASRLTAALMALMFPLAVFGLQQEPRKDAGPEPGKTTTQLSIETIMKGEDFVGTSPANLLWAVDGKTLYFQWKRPGDRNLEYYSVTASKPVPAKVKPEDFLKLPPLPAASRSMFRFSGFGPAGAEFRYDKAKKRVLIVQNGDIFLLDLVKGKATQLTSTDEREANARFSFDEKKIVFLFGDNLFLLSLEDGSLRQLTSFTRRTPPPEPKPGELEKWYQDQQKELFLEFQKTRVRAGGLRDVFPALSKAPRRKPYVLKEGERISLAELSPDEKYVFFMIPEESAEAKETIVPNYVTRSGYTETIESHAKAGDASRQVKGGIMSVETGEVKWIDFGQGERKIYAGAPIWSPDGKTCVLQARADDRKDQWLLRLDPATGKTDVIFQVHDEAWVGPLGLTNIFWWPDSRSLSLISEKDGYAHLYKIGLDGKNFQQLTKGTFEVRDARLSLDGKKIYLSTSEEHPGERHFYWMSAEGGKRTKITSLQGQNEVALSPDETVLAVIHSYTNKPAELYLQANSPQSAPKQVTLSTTEGFRSIPWYDPEVISIKARDGVDVYARLFAPVKIHPQRPAVIFIHGAGYLQNADRGWSEYYREFMFHNFLMEQGYFILDIDYRGSSGYGRDFRAGIYRHMGGKDLEDLIDGAKYLVETCQVNPGRIGCYGGSYGGFLTLMALFKAGDVFKAGAALRPVSDWAHYHPGYTVDILNLPQKDPEAYKQSSPIYFADGLKGALLICHGMVDTNVHFQDTVRLVQRLIELGKENWNVAFYPVEDHTFQNASSWTDEYRRIFRLFEQNLK